MSIVIFFFGASAGCGLKFERRASTLVSILSVAKQAHHDPRSVGRCAGRAEAAAQVGNAGFLAGMGFMLAGNGLLGRDEITCNIFRKGLRA